MPELPEVDAARESIHEHFAGQRVVRAQAFQDDKVMEGTDAAEIERVLAGRRLLAPRRKGKHLWFEMEGEQPLPLFHLGMAGAFEIRGASVVKYKRAREAGDEWPPKWCKVTMEFEGGGALAFVDSRRFGRIRVVQQPHASPPISELGWDALTELPDLKAFATLLQSSQRVVKAVLLDQAVLCGIGNWIADEVLFQARVHPESRAKALSEDDLARLHKAINHVLSVAVAVRADSSQFPEDWLFHVRWNKVPGSILGHRITFITSGGRTSAVVPALQGAPRTAPRKASKTSPGPDASDATEPTPSAKPGKRRAQKGAAEGEEQEGPGSNGTKPRKRRTQKGAAEGGEQEEPGSNGTKPRKRRAQKGAAEGGEQEEPASDGTKPRRKRARASAASAKAETGVTSAGASGAEDPEGALNHEEVAPRRRSTRGSSRTAVVNAKSKASRPAGGRQSGAEKTRGRGKRRN